MKSKEEIKNEVIEVIDRFFQRYNLPSKYIPDDEMNVFLNVVEAHFLAHNNIDEYEIAINVLIRRALYFVSLNNATKFTMDYLLESMSDLYVFYIPQDEIWAMQSEIMDKIEQKGYRK